jgi:hypothetical protein
LKKTPRLQFDKRHVGHFVPVGSEPNRDCGGAASPCNGSPFLAAGIGFPRSVLSDGHYVWCVLLTNFIEWETVPAEECYNFRQVHTNVQALVRLFRDRVAVSDNP